MTEIPQIVAKRLHEYTDAFIRAGQTKDHTLLRPFTHIPLMDVVAGRVFVVDTEAKSDKRWSRILADLPEDYDHSVQHSVDVTMLTPKSAWVTIDCSRFKKSGEAYYRFWDSYIFIETKEDWKITTWIVHEPGKTPHTVRT